MTSIVIGRKDHTGIACSPSPRMAKRQKIMYFEISLALILIAIGATIMFLIQ